MSCTLCPLHKGVQSICIPGRGSEAPRFLFVGQGPGREEDQANKPFVGPSGRLLTKFIQDFDLRPARLTNTVRCWPPKDREPRVEEVEKCFPYLAEEIKNAKPEIIVAVGGVALKALTGKVGIQTYAGRVAGEFEGAKVFAMLHPAYILRAPKAVHKFEQQFRELKRISQNGTGEKKVPFRVVTPGQASDIIFNFGGKFIAFDFETNGRYKHEGGEIRCVSFCAGDAAYVVKMSDGYNFNEFLEYLRKAKRLCAHNSIFERRWLMDLGFGDPLSLDYDTMLMDYIWQEERPHDLQSVASYWLGGEFQPWKIDLLMKEKEWTWETIPDEVLFAYSAKDSYYAYKICEAMLEKFKSLEDKSILEYYKTVLLPTSVMCARYEHRGLAVDKEWIERVKNSFARQMENQCKVMDKFTPKDKLPFNPGSPKQVSEVLKSLGVRTDETVTGQWSVAAGVLERTKARHPFLKAYSAWKEKKTLENNFLNKFEGAADYKGIVRPSFNPAFQVTGRISVSKPPAANIPRDPEVRGMVISRFEDGQVLALDYKQLEMRLVASEANEGNMLQIFEAGKDVHDETARTMFGEGFTPEDRAISKNINFGTIYGISPYSLSLKFNVPERKAEDFVSRHKRAYPAVYAWMAEQHKYIRGYGFVTSRLGQARHFPGWQGASGCEKSRMMRQAGNFPIQSLGAHITNLSAFHIDKFLTKNFKSLVFHQVHDSILVDVHPEDDAGEVKMYCGRIMSERVPKRYAPFLCVKLPIEAEISKRWGQAE